MSGHSKWSNIKHKKEKADSQKGKIFTKIGREIVVAVKEGGGPDPEQNSKLKDVIAKAKANNIPNDNIIRSIKKASGELGNVHYDEIVYEGYGPGGVAIIVEAVTDNRNRAASEVRYIFDKNGGALGATGCVAWMFDKKGVLIIEKTERSDDDEVMLNAIDSGAEDFTVLEDAYEILTDPANFSEVREALERKGYEFLSAEIQRIPQNTVDVSGELAESIEKIIDMLDDNEDVQNVYHNANFPEE